jgi:aminopeptidase N
MAHPVRPDSYVEINNFYTATVYDKGAEVVRMMQTLVGRDGFARGMTLYFERHDGSAVTCDDFAQAIADANPQSDLARLLPQFKRWYSQAGTPRITARGRYDAPRAPTRCCWSRAARRLPTSPTSSPVSSRCPWASSAAMAARSRCSSRTSRCRLRAASRPSVCWCSSRPREFFTFVNVDAGARCRPSCGGFSARGTLVVGLSDGDLLRLLQHDTDPFNRWEAGQAWRSRACCQQCAAASRS